jgi:uncharacterized RDD family membrane protein YckC
MRARAALKRLAAFALDWCLIAAWGGLLFVLFTQLVAGLLPAPGGPWSAQLVGLLSMTLPVILYFSLCEASAWRGTLGKRALGLEVVDEAGGRLPTASALLRNGVKFAPWEFGHLLAQQAVFSGEQGMPAWTILPGLVAFGGPLIWVVELFRTGRTPYDRVSTSRVRRRNPNRNR